MYFVEVFVIFVLPMLSVYLTNGVVTGNDLYEYAKFGNSYYRFLKQARLWEDARQVCELDGAHLAIINSKEEESFLISLYERSSGAEEENYTFVGYHDYFRRGVWSTIDGKSIYNAGYDPWAPKQPSNLYSADPEFEKHCGALYSDGLHNYACFFRLPYICEIPETALSSYNAATADGIQFRNSAKNTVHKKCHGYSCRRA